MCVFRKPYQTLLNGMHKIRLANMCCTSAYAMLGSFLVLYFVFGEFRGARALQLHEQSFDVVATHYENVGTMGATWSFPASAQHYECVEQFGSDDVARDDFSTTAAFAQNISAVLPDAAHIQNMPGVDESQQARFATFRTLDPDQQSLFETVMDDADATVIDGVEAYVWVHANTSNGVVDKRVFWEFGDYRTEEYADSDNRAQTGAWPSDRYERRVYGSEQDRWALSSEQWRTAFDRNQNPMAAFFLDVQHSTDEWRRVEIGCVWFRVHLQSAHTASTTITTASTTTTDTTAPPTTTTDVEMMTTVPIAVTTTPAEQSSSSRSSTMPTESGQTSITTTTTAHVSTTTAPRTRPPPSTIATSERQQLRGNLEREAAAIITIVSMLLCCCVSILFIAWRRHHKRARRVRGGQRNNYTELVNGIEIVRQPDAQNGDGIVWGDSDDDDVEQGANNEQDGRVHAVLDTSSSSDDDHAVEEVAVTTRSAKRRRAAQGGATRPSRQAPIEASATMRAPLPAPIAPGTMRRDDTNAIRDTPIYDSVEDIRTRVQRMREQAVDGTNVDDANYMAVPAFGERKKED